MAFALVVLAIGSALTGYAGLTTLLGGRDRFTHYLEPSFGIVPVEEVAQHGLEGHARCSCRSPPRSPASASPPTSS